MKKLLMCLFLIFCILMCSACQKTQEDDISNDTTQAESSKQESTKDEPEKAETTKDEPEKNDTTKNETTKNETTKQEESGSENEEEIMVWVSGSGTKYHSKSSCSNMKSPKQMTLEEAEEQGYEPCKKCH